MKPCVVCGQKSECVSNYRAFFTNGLKGKLKILVRDRFAPFKLILSDRLRHIALNPFRGRVLKCESCGFSFMESMPSNEELELYYQTLYWGDRNATQDLEQYKTCPRASSQVTLIENYLHPQNSQFDILEIGAGAATPSLLLREKLFAQASVKIDVVEPGQEWKEYYSKLDINLAASFFPNQVSKQYSHIHASHWLEHVISPMEVINNIYAALTYNGTVFIEVPYADREYWKLPILDTPHTLFFSPTSLRNLFERNSFSTIFIDRYGISLKDYSSNKWLKDEEFGERNENGFWIRALFQKKN